MKETNRYIHEFLVRHLGKNPVSFHMPGHSGAKLLDREFRARIGEFDITEIPGADNLHRPVGIIRKAQENVATAYKAHQSYFLVNGSTAGIHAILKYAQQKARKVILSRDVHVSALHAAILFDVEPVFFDIGYGSDGLPLPATPNNLKHTLREHSDAAGVLVTSPNYYGMTAAIQEMVCLAHACDLFLAVDQAHGAHFPFYSRFPRNACEDGADMVCMSAHKTLQALGQGAFLHTADTVNLRDVVSMLQTTSPSYPILASLENAVWSMGEQGEEEYEKLFHRIKDFTNALFEDIRYAVLDANDFTRVVINVKKTGRTGFEIAQILRDEYNIFIEMADFFRLVLITTWANDRHDFLRIEKALKDIPCGTQKQKEIPVPGIPERMMEMGKAYRMPRKWMNLDGASGRICGTIIMSYPPGTPLLIPGDRIEEDAVDAIQALLDAGGTVIGLENRQIGVVA